MKSVQGSRSLGEQFPSDIVHGGRHVERYFFYLEPFEKGKLFPNGKRDHGCLYSGNHCHDSPLLGICHDRIHLGAEVYLVYGEPRSYVFHPYEAFFREMMVGRGIVIAPWIFLALSNPYFLALRIHGPVLLLGYEKCRTELDVMSYGAPRYAIEERALFQGEVTGIHELILKNQSVLAN